MRERVGVDEKLPPVAIPALILNELYRHALDTQPEECCGLIVGDEIDRFQRLEACRNEMTQRHQADPVAYPRDGCEAFYMTETDYMRAEARAESSGLKVTAVYHSHVGSAVYLSAMDLAYAESGLFPFPGADQIVVSLFDGKIAGVGLFRRPSVENAFCGHRVEAQSP
jgi:proteasome lid subunit RPN8/RPN11